MCSLAGLENRFPNVANLIFRKRMMKIDQNYKLDAYLYI